MRLNTRVYDSYSLDVSLRKIAYYAWLCSQVDVLFDIACVDLIKVVNINIGIFYYVSVITNIRYDTDMSPINAFKLNTWRTPWGIYGVDLKFHLWHESNYR